MKDYVGVRVIETVNWLKANGHSVIIKANSDPDHDNNYDVVLHATLHPRFNQFDGRDAGIES